MNIDSVDWEKEGEETDNEYVGDTTSDIDEEEEDNESAFIGEQEQRLWVNTTTITMIVRDDDNDDDFVDHRRISTWGQWEVSGKPWSLCFAANVEECFFA